MSKIFRMHLPKPFLLLVLIEALILVCSLYVGLVTSWVDFDYSWAQFVRGLPSALGYTGIFMVIMFSLGIYSEIVAVAFYQVVIRLTVAFVLGFVVLSAIFYAFPSLLVWRSVMAGTLISSYLGILVTHYVFLHAIDLTPLKRRVVVLGAGPQAARIDRLERYERSMGFVCLGFFPLTDEDPEVPPARLVPSGASLISFVRQRNVREIVIAAKERRGTLPMEDLTECAFQGIDIIDYLTFWEREANRVDIDALPQNWMHFITSHPGGRLHQFLKRLFDLVVSVTALILLLPLMACTALVHRFMRICRYWSGSTCIWADWHRLRTETSIVGGMKDSSSRIQSFKIFVGCTSCTWVLFRVLKDLMRRTSAFPLFAACRMRRKSS